jgi:hypothetical protein
MYRFPFWAMFCQRASGMQFPPYLPNPIKALWPWKKLPYSLRSIPTVSQVDIVSFQRSTQHAFLCCVPRLDMVRLTDNVQIPYRVSGGDIWVNRTKDGSRPVFHWSQHSEGQTLHLKFQMEGSLPSCWIAGTPLIIPPFNDGNVLAYATL